VIVGSGPSGAAAAARLLGRGERVVVLDAGGLPPRGVVVKVAGNIVFRWQDKSGLRRDRLSPESTDVMWFSTLGLGGLSNYWTGAVPRYAPPDFTEGGRLDERFVWPVSYGDLEPYYRAAEQYLAVTAGAAIRGVPANDVRYQYREPADWRSVMAGTGGRLGAIPLAKGAPWMLARRGVEFDSYHCILGPLCTSATLELRTGAVVERLCWSPQQSRVTAVEYVDVASKERRRVPARAVVVAAGAIDTAMILRRSTSADFPDGIGNTHGLLGTHLHDHPREWWRAELARPMRALAHPLYLGRADHDDSEPLMAVAHTIGLPSPLARPRTWVRAKVASVGVQVFGTMIPDPEHRIGFDPSNDPIDVRPRIELRYDQRTLDNLTSARSRFVEVLSSAGLAAKIPGPFTAVVPGTSVHYGGTARMHRRPELGVVDGHSRVHDVPNVYVGDMSVFTTGPEKNPTLTAMALAIRAADHLVERS
jgi:choline dehydrogenase-like flavoprotein